MGTDPGAGERFRVLALDGGGVRGAYTASVLSTLEDATGERCCESFDLICGASTGGLLALGLSIGIPARGLVDFYRTYAASVFPLSGVAQRSKGRWRQLFRPKYDPDVLRKALVSVLGDSRLSHAKTRLVIPAYDITEGRIFLFKTAHHPRFQFDVEIPAVEIALATSAAPTYFPSQRIAGHAAVDYIDGGVWANTPSLVGIVEAVGFLEQDLGDIDVLSIGTTESVANFSSVGRAGAMGWGTNLIDLFMRANSQSAVSMSGILAGSHHRVDAVVPDEWSSMDDATKARELIALGYNDAKKAINLDVVCERFLNGTHVNLFESR